MFDQVFYLKINETKSGFKIFRNEFCVILLLHNAIGMATFRDRSHSHLAKAIFCKLNFGVGNGIMAPNGGVHAGAAF